MLYKCAQLTDGCSSCTGFRVANGFECVWCDRPNDVRDSCSYTGDCDTVIPSSMCPAPILTDFSPKSGPIEGGTTITITGRELGVTFDDFINNSITVGGFPCIPSNHESDYIPGRQIRCNTTHGASLGAKTIQISLPHGSGTSNTHFTYAAPEIMRVVPIWGPVAGGTRLTVWGSNLNIGNIEDTMISIVTGTKCTIE